VRLPVPPLLVITDRSQARRPLEDVAAAAFAGGCRWLSLREKDLPTAARRDLLRRLIAVGRPYGATVGIHDDLDAAIAEGAAVLHLPDGTSARDARARLGDGVLIGVSAHDAASIARAVADGADYITLSPLFISASKPGYGPALGLQRFAQLAREASLPVLALSGIDSTTIATALAAGAAGVAVMGAVMAAADPAHVTAALIERMNAPALMQGPPRA
jgi:thiamine-phosphate pyrophosphorylase